MGSMSSPRSDDDSGSSGAPETCTDKSFRTAPELRPQDSQASVVLRKLYNGLSLAPAADLEVDDSSEDNEKAVQNPSLSQKTLTSLRRWTLVLLAVIIMFVKCIIDCAAIADK